jgi:putative Holliday junction resolvase
MTGPAALTVLAFDFGLRRIGVAVGNTLTGTAQSVAAVPATDAGPDWAAIARCVGEWQPQVAVVGVPYNMDGSAGALTAAALGFAAELRTRFGLEVHGLDERLSSREAEDELKRRRQSGELGRRVRRGDIDREAACVLLRQWLNGPARG